MRPVDAAPKKRFDTVDFIALDGWGADDHVLALQTYLKTAELTGRPIAPPNLTNPKRWFEANFRPWLLSTNAHLTAYYEPEIEASFERNEKFKQPIYALPETGWAHQSRREIDAGGLAGKGLEIAWIATPVENFLMQVQGCGRLRMPGGGILRVGYAASNGHAYRSIGKEMVRRGLVSDDEVSANTIRSYVTANPVEGLALLQHNESFVYFKTLPDLRPKDGPIGSLGISITPLRSVAVDPLHIPLGSPVWIETGAQGRLMIAQDIGGAIKGPARADLFLGSGHEAGEAAGQYSKTGRLTVFWPKSGL